MTLTLTQRPGQVVITPVCINNEALARFCTTNDMLLSSVRVHLIIISYFVIREFLLRSCIVHFMF